MGDVELEKDDTLEDNGVDNGARLTLQLARGRPSSHVVIDAGRWRMRMGFAGNEEAPSDELLFDYSR